MAEQELPPVGSSGTLQKPHPYAGSRGKVVARQHFQHLGLGCVVALSRDDAMDGHRVGLFNPRHFRMEP